VFRETRLLGSQGIEFRSGGECADKREKMMRLMRQEDRWQFVAVALLGAWPIASFLVNLASGQRNIEKSVLFFVERGRIASWRNSSRSKRKMLQVLRWEQFEVQKWYYWWLARPK
jgi:hypothetical protein